MESSRSLLRTKWGQMPRKCNTCNNQALAAVMHYGAVANAQPVHKPWHNEPALTQLMPLILPSLNPAKSFRMPHPHGVVAVAHQANVCAQPKEAVASVGTPTHIQVQAKAHTGASLHAAWYRPHTLTQDGRGASRRGESTRPPPSGQAGTRSAGVYVTQSTGDRKAHSQKATQMPHPRDTQHPTSRPGFEPIIAGKETCRPAHDHKALHGQTGWHGTATGPCGTTLCRHAHESSRM